MADDDDLVVDRAKIASYSSRCRVCGEMIEEGERILFDEYEDAWVHEDCCDE